MMLFIASRIHRLDVLEYLETAIPCLPIAHAFGRIGCHFASCCYGIPYNGIGSIVYHAPSIAPADVPLFPVQLLESSVNLLLAGVLIVYIYKNGHTANSIRIYVFSYASVRFLLEYLRYDMEERGRFMMFSTSQWISIFLILLLYLIYPYLKRMDCGKSPG